MIPACFKFRQDFWKPFGGLLVYAGPLHPN
jgi:hypothetical protein